MNAYDYRIHLDYLLSDPRWRCTEHCFAEATPGEVFSDWAVDIQPFAGLTGIIKEPVRHLEAVIARLDCSEEERSLLLAELTLLVAEGSL